MAEWDKTPFDHLTTSINGHTLADAYRLGVENERKRILNLMEKEYLSSPSSAFSGTAIRMLTEEKWQALKEEEHEGLD